MCFHSFELNLLSRSRLFTGAVVLLSCRGLLLSNKNVSQWTVRRSLCLLPCKFHFQTSWLKCSFIFTYRLVSTSDSSVVMCTGRFSIGAVTYG